MGIINELTILPQMGAEIIYPVDVHGSILLLFPESAHQDEEIQFLNKVFTAAHRDMENDVVIWPLPANVRLSFPDLRQHLHFSDLYMFGVEPEQIGLQSSLPMGVPVHLDQVFLFRTDSPLKVMNSRDIKAPLWDLLQKRYLNGSAE